MGQLVIRTFCQLHTGLEVFNTTTSTAISNTSNMGSGMMENFTDTGSGAMENSIVVSSGVCADAVRVIYAPYRKYLRTLHNYSLKDLKWEYSHNLHQILDSHLG